MKHRRKTNYWAKTSKFGALVSGAVAATALAVMVLAGGSTARGAAAPDSVVVAQSTQSAAVSPKTAEAKPPVVAEEAAAPVVEPVTAAAIEVAPLPVVVPPVTYVVQPGDNLIIIAKWFDLHGFGELYEANKAVLGANPDLIYPGQVITISAAGVTMLP